MKFISAEAAIEKIINILVVNLYVLALYFKVDITDVLIFKHRIVVVKTLPTVWLLLVIFLGPLQCRFFDFYHLREKILKTSW